LKPKKREVRLIGSSALWSKMLSNFERNSSPVRKTWSDLQLCFKFKHGFVCCTIVDLV